ncbi:F-box protein [Ruminococcus sp.]
MRTTTIISCCPNQSRAAIRKCCRRWSSIWRNLTGAGHFGMAQTVMLP